MPHWRRYAAFTLLTGLLVILQYHLWFQQDGLRDMLQLRRELTRQAFDNQDMKKKNEELVRQIARLKRSEDATESRARNELGMIKKNETFYQYIKYNKQGEGTR